MKGKLESKHENNETMNVTQWTGNVKGQTGIEWCKSKTVGQWKGKLETK